MKKRNVRMKVVTLVGVLSLLLSLLCSCKKDPLLTQVSPMPLPDGAELIILYLHHEGMAMEPYYIMQKMEQKICLKMTDNSPFESLDQDAAEQELKDENVQMVLIDDTAVLRKMEEIIARYGALAWDGFDRSNSKNAVFDSGDRYELYFELSDGTTVRVNSYNCCPAGFVELQHELQEIFHTNLELFS